MKMSSDSVSYQVANYTIAEFFCITADSRRDIIQMQRVLMQSVRYLRKRNS